ncbi:MAG: response regulator, partial [Pseudomonadota bacterium]
KTMEIELIQKQEQQHQAMAEKQALEKQLLQLQKIEAIGALAGGIAHDFNNILFPIIGHAEILMEDCANDHPHKESINEILIGAKRAKELVNQILTFSRQTQETAGPLKPDLIVKEVIKLIRSTLPATIKINKFIEPDCMMILADPTQIHQVAMNLITNDYHAMQDSGGVLTIKLQNLSDMDSDQEQLKLWKDPVVNLFVGDTGTGMDHLTIKKIFDPYFTTKPKGKGTGLGLSVVHGIVTNLGGKIIVTSTPGEGSRFDVYIPAIRQKHSTAPLAPHKKKSPGGNEHILLVDDEQTILDIEEKMLKRLGYTITTRNSCHEALQLILDVPDKFDMVITDMTMPEMTGDIFARKLMDIVPDLPVLICTGFSEQINLEKARSIGVKGLLFKPMIKSEFAKTIRTVLDENQRLKAP